MRCAAFIIASAACLCLCGCAESAPEFEQTEYGM